MKAANDIGRPRGSDYQVKRLRMIYLVLAALYVAAAIAGAGIGVLLRNSDEAPRFVSGAVAPG